MPNNQEEALLRVEHLCQYFTSGRVLVGTANPDLLGEFLEKGDMVILGDREGDQLEALNQHVSCIVVGLNMEISDRVMALTWKPSRFRARA